VREELSVDRDANAIRLRRSTFLGTFLLVEGSSDKTFYERFTDKITCQLFVTSGKNRAIKILEILDKASFQGVLAIVDADFDHLEILPDTSPNLIRTDTHDLETMSLNSSALEKVIAEFGSEDKIVKFGRDIRKVLLEAGMPIGYLLWISQLDRLNLTFSNITFSKFINDRTLQVDECKLIQEVKNKSQNSALKNEDIQERLANQRSDDHDPWQVCCGHHLVKILSFSLCKVIGSAKVDPDTLERSLRLAYEETYFCQTQTYLSVRSWESSNQPFKVLRNDIGNNSHFSRGAM
jgi:hypothetical protein